jgi:hypothetical protein
MGHTIIMGGSRVGNPSMISQNGISLSKKSGAIEVMRLLRAELDRAEDVRIRFISLPIFDFMLP